MSQQKNRNRLPFVIVLAITAVVGLTFIAVAGPTAPEATQSTGWILQNIAIFGNRIDMVSESEGWILKLGGLSPFTGDRKAGYLYRWNGEHWTFFGSLPHSQDVIRGDIDMVSPIDGWVVLGGPLSGSSNLAESSIYRWNGNSWIPYGIITAPNAVSLDSIDMLSPSEGWASGGFNFGTIYYRWDGTAWERFKQGFSDYAFNDLDMVSSTDGWAIGRGISRWDGLDWFSVTSPITTTLNAISMVSASDGWIVGGRRGESSAILRWDGLSWTEVTSPVSERLSAVDMIASDDGWAVGDDGVILHWDGISWTQFTDLPLTSNDWSAINMISSSLGWITGSGGILSYETRPELAVNFTDGAPSSFFTLSGSDYPANEEATVNVNGHDLGTVTTDENGAFMLILSTAEADEGIYIATVSVNPSATTQFLLDVEAPLRPQQGTGTEIPVPSDIALTEQLFLPNITR